MSNAIAAMKTLDAFKSFPNWLLAGLTISLLSIRFCPPLLAALPKTLQSAEPIALFVFTILTGSKFAASGIGYLRIRRRKLLARDQVRLLNLYQPLAALFLTLHICTTCCAPTSLYHRLENAWAELSAYRRRSRGLKRAWRALFDKQIKRSAEIEFGGGFPLSQIINLVRKETRYADPELLHLVNRADRSRYEKPDKSDHGLLTEEELALFEHIEAKYRYLSARVFQDV